MLRATALVWMSYFVSLIVTESSTRRSVAAPLILPNAFASVTVPVTAAPFGITSLPSTCTGSATVAVNLSPLLFPFELTFSFSRTVSTVPSGKVTGLGAGCCVSEGGLVDSAAAGPFAASVVPAVVPVGAVGLEVSSGFLLHAAMRNAKTIMARAADFKRISTSSHQSLAAVVSEPPSAPQPWQT